MDTVSPGSLKAGRLLLRPGPVQPLAYGACGVQSVPGAQHTAPQYPHVQCVVPKACTGLTCAQHLVSTEDSLPCPQESTGGDRARNSPFSLRVTWAEVVYGPRKDCFYPEDTRGLLGSEMRQPRQFFLPQSLQLLWGAVE